jgi:mandelate racemase
MGARTGCGTFKISTARNPLGKFFITHYIVRERPNLKGFFNNLATLIQAMSITTRIKNVKIRTVLVPLNNPHKTASGVITTSPLVLTDILLDNGITGHSIVFTYNKMALKPTAQLIADLGLLIHEDILAPLDTFEKLSSRFRLLGTQGLVGMAISAIDMALWDAFARCQNSSLTRVLGGIEKPIRVYGAIGFDGPKESAIVAENWVRQGLTGVKAKIGYPTVQEDVQVIRAIRKAVGESVSIMVDYNQSLLPVEAIQRLHILDSEGLAWIEEPTLAHDFSGHAVIAREIKTPIQCGENWWGILDMQNAINSGASDFMMLDIMKIGGVTGWGRAASLAEAKGIPISTHLWSEISAQLLCITPTAHWLEYSDWWNAILKEPLELNDKGFAVLSNNIGSGVDWNEDAIKSFLV